MRFGLPLLLSTALAFAQDGATVYKQRCASCHDAPAGRVPPVSALRAMSTRSILASLDSGTMKKQADGLNSAERFALVGYLLSKAAVVTPLPATAFCKADKKPVGDLLQGPQWSAWGVGLTNTRFQDAAAAQLTPTDIPSFG